MKKFAPLLLLLLGNEIISLLIILAYLAAFIIWLLGEATEGGFFN